jgi:HTH-type transcriptional regulator/antitoxin HigA
MTVGDAREEKKFSGESTMREPEHPGVRLREEMKARDWAQADLAAILGRSIGTINAIIRGKRGISYDMARDLGACFGSPNAFEWRHMYDLYLLSRVKEKEARSSRPTRHNPPTCSSCGAPWRAA